MGTLVNPYVLAAAGGVPADAWVLPWQQNGGSNALAGFAAKTFRIRLPASALKNVYGSKIRLTFKAGADAMTIGDCFFGLAATSGDPWDFAATPMRVTFNGGSNSSSSITAGATKLSDEHNFTIDENTDYLVAFYNVDSNAPFFLNPSLQDGVIGWYKAGNDASTVDATGYGNSEIYYASYGLVKFEVWGVLDGSPITPAVPKDPFGSYTVFHFTADDGVLASDAALAPFGDYTIFGDVAAIVDGGEWVLTNTGTLGRGHIDWLEAHDDFFNVLGTDWTIEGFITYPIATPTHKLFAYHGDEGFFVRRSLKLHIAGGFYKMYVNGDTTNDFEITSSVQVSAGARHHIAVNRVGNTIYMFLNGVLVASGAFTGDVHLPAVVGIEGRVALNLEPQNAKGDDWRWTKGIGRYHVAFTPPAHLARPVVTPVSPDDHTYWRILVTQNNGQPYTSLAGNELRMYASTDGTGPNLVSASTGAISGSATGVFGNVVAGLIDGNTSTQYVVNETGNDWVTFRFNRPVNVNSVTMQVIAGQEGLMPMDFSIRYSNDGTTYAQKWAEAGEVWTTGPTTRVYAA